MLHSTDRILYVGTEDGLYLAETVQHGLYGQKGHFRVYLHLQQSADEVIE